MRCPLAFFIKPARLYTPFSEPVFAMIFLASGSAEIEPRPEIVPSTPYYENQPCAHSYQLRSPHQVLAKVD